MRNLKRVNLFKLNRPPLKKTQMFGGIAGIISERTERQDDERSS